MWGRGDPPTAITPPQNQTLSRSDSEDPLRRYRQFFIASAHFHHISTCGGSFGDGFRIVPPVSYTSLIVTITEFGLVFEVSFRAWDGQTTDTRRRRTTPLLKVSHLLLQAGPLPTLSMQTNTHMDGM